MPIVKSYRIKDDGVFKCRSFVWGNLEKYIGDRYAPTICSDMVNVCTIDIT
jgi:hypothetical protein